MKSSISMMVAMLAAAVVASEIETEGVWAQPDQYPEPLEVDYLEARHAHVPTLDKPHGDSHVARCAVEDKKDAIEDLLYEDSYDDDYIDYDQGYDLDHGRGYDYGYESYGHGHREGLAPRGPIRQPRKQKKEEPLVAEDHPVVDMYKHHDRYHDWRDYDPYFYGDKDPYSHCVWPKNLKDLDTKEYQALPAICKEEIIWRNILENPKRERFYTGFEFERLFNQDMNLSYDTVSDSMPAERLKVTHPVGIHSKVEFIAHPDSPYTGIFQGAKHGIMRISETTKTTPETPKTAPGHGVKFLRDGMYSANWVTMFSFDGQKSFNFIKNRWTTILREFNNQCARETIGKKLATVTDHVGATSVMDLSMFDQYGNEVEYPHWPYQVDVEGYDVYGWTDEYQNDFQDQFSVIPMNTAIFKVFAFDEPPELGGEDRLIGWLVTRSDQISSFWGDQKLFFQHRRMDDDIKHRPHYFDWLQFWDNGKFDETPVANPAPAQRCPFFYLFEKAGIV